MGFKGSVDSFSLADVFQNLAMNQQTGTLRVFTPTNEEKFVFFKAGQVRGLARGNNIPLFPPEVLVARGHVTQSQLDDAAGRQKETLKSVFLCLMDLGTLTQEQFDEVTRLQIEEEIYDLFGWEKASFEFNEGPPAEGLFPSNATAGKSPSLPISHLIMEAARRVDEWERLRQQIPSFKEIYAMDAAARKAMEKGEMEADAIEKRLASLIDSARDVDDLILDSYLFKYEVLSALSGFLQSSLIRPATVHELSLAEQECYRKGLGKRRIKVLERILALAGENPKIRKDLADSLAKDDQGEKACIHYVVLAEAQLKAGKESEAVEFYKKILSLSSKHVKAHEQLAQIYAKNGQKREAFVHYQELYEMFRDQNRLPEARKVAAAALECDANQTDLRNNLIELLLQDNQKEAASQQLEILGDQACRAGNIKFAADSYRRAMQLRPNHKGLKKKLADVMLTKEDRLARKRKALVFLVMMIIAGLAVAGVLVKEHLNKEKFDGAMRTAQPMIDQAADASKKERYREAKTQYVNAMNAIRPMQDLLSPLMSYNKKAAEEVKRLQELANEADKNAEDNHMKMARAAELDLESGDSAARAKRIYEARELYKKVIDNADAADKTKKLAQEGLDKVSEMIGKLEKGLERLKKEPNQEFETVEREYAYKQEFIRDFQAIPEFKMKEILLPLFVKPDTDSVKVRLDGNFLGSINVDGGREVNTFRYAAGESHKFEFMRKGYKTVTLNTAENQNFTFRFKMEREPAISYSLRPRLTGDVRLSGEPAIEDGYMYVGTTEGSILQINLADGKVTASYDVPAGSPLNRDVYGAIQIHKRAGKPSLIIYALRAGTAIALEPAAGKLKEIWRADKITEKDLTARPSLIRLSLLPNIEIFAMPSDKQLALLDCNSGAPVAGSPVKVPRTLMSSVTAVEIGNDPVILAGCKDGTVLGISLKTQNTRQWTTNAEAVAMRGTPIMVDSDLIVGADDGILYGFRGTKPFPEFKMPLDNAGSIVSTPLVIKKRIYVGAIDREGFWCGDLGSQRTAWKITLTPENMTIGAVPNSPALRENTVYFTTDRGRLYALDADRGTPRWNFQIEGAKPIISPPLVSGNRVYIVSKDGLILGFDEDNE